MMIRTFFTMTRLFGEDKKLFSEKVEIITPIRFYGQRESIIADIFYLLENKTFHRLYDPFSGSGSISFTAMKKQLAKEYYINDTDPILCQIWETIKAEPEAFLNFYKTLADEYISSNLKTSFYNQKLVEFNSLTPQLSDKVKSVSLFVFLINFSVNNMPIFDHEKKLSTNPNIDLNIEKENTELVSFQNLSMNLSKLLQSNNVVFTSGDFLECLNSATENDLVILDPPYPTQEHSIYYKIKDEKQLQNDLRLTLEKFKHNKVPFIIFYGAVRVALENQFDEEKYGVQHLIRLTTSPVHGDGFEHVYISKEIQLNRENLPRRIAFYHDYFEPNIEITQEKYDTALVEMQQKRDSFTLNDNTTESVALIYT